uniref:BZIP domain-containing protein n=1 Tax=Oryza brachyantha TaxID=4533 RepID=J3MCA7_ORYBR
MEMPPEESALARQGSIYSLTFDEFQSALGTAGKDFGSMNMDELLRNIWTAEESQALFSQSNVVAPAMQLGNGMVPGVVGQGAAAAMTVAAPATPVVLNGLGKVEGGDLSSLSPVPYPFDTALRVRKGPTVEKVVERRQRRMIKNRESAARSRARKQAYIMELEAEVAKLKEQKAELQKKQVEMIQKQKDEVMERITQQLGPKAKRFCLRRTLTGPC